MKQRPPDAAEAALLLGLLIGEGHFGGDGKQPHVVLRLHVRHEPLFRWIAARWPQQKLYGPYHHDGRRYFQMMWRGPALRYELMPWLESLPWAEIDPYSYGRYARMKETYGLGDVPAYGKKPLAFPREAPLPAEGTLLGDPVAAREAFAGDLPLLQDEDPDAPA